MMVTDSQLVEVEGSDDAKSWRPWYNRLKNIKTGERKCILLWNWNNSTGGEEMEALTLVRRSCPWEDGLEKAHATYNMALMQASCTNYTLGLEMLASIYQFQYLDLGCEHLLFQDIQKKKTDMKQKQARFDAVEARLPRWIEHKCFSLNQNLKLNEHAYTINEVEWRLCATLLSSCGLRFPGYQHLQYPGPGSDWVKFIRHVLSEGLQPEVLVAAASKLLVDEMELIFSATAPDKTTSQSVILAACRNQKYDEEAIVRLLEVVEDEIDYLPLIIGAVKSNHRVKADNLLRRCKHLLGQRIPVEMDAIETALGEWWLSTQSLSLLLGAARRPLIIPEQLLVSIARVRSNHCVEMMDLVLELGGIEFPITEPVLIAVAKRQTHGRILMARMLRREGCATDITQNVMIAAATTEVSTWNHSILPILRCLKRLPVTSAVIETAKRAGAKEAALTTLAMLHRNGPLTLDEIEVLLGDDQTKYDSISILIRERGCDFRVTEDIMKLAISGSRLTVPEPEWNSDSVVTNALYPDPWPRCLQLDPEAIETTRIDRAEVKHTKHPILRLLVQHINEDDIAGILSFTKLAEYAAFEGNVKLLERIKLKGMNDEVKSLTDVAQLRLAIQSGESAVHVDFICQQIIPWKHVTSVVEVCNALLIRAIDLYDINTIDTLLRNRLVNPNFIDHKGRTPLHIAAYNGLKQNIFRCLLEHGAGESLDIYDSDLKSPRGLVNAIVSHKRTNISIWPNLITGVEGAEAFGVCSSFGILRPTNLNTQTL